MRKQAQTDYLTCSVLLVIGIAGFGIRFCLIPEAWPSEAASLLCPCVNGSQGPHTGAARGQAGQARGGKSVSDRPDGDMENTHCLKMVSWEAALGLLGHPFVYAFFLQEAGHRNVDVKL